MLAALLRAWAVIQLPLDYDEPVYVNAAFQYAEAMQAGNWDAIIDYAENREHPPLVKLLYGAGILALGGHASWSNGLLVSRAISALFGTLAVLLLTLVSPIAGGLLAAQTLVVKYTSQAYLEALPHLTSLTAVLALRRSTRSLDRWFWLSALALGLTAAGKYSYFPILLVVLYLAIWEKRVRWRSLLPYLVTAAVIFWLFNPTLWHEPVTRLADSLFFHARYSQSARVELSGYGPWQPLYWLSRSVGWDWHPDVFFYFGLDGIISLLALGGIYLHWRSRRFWVIVWIVISLVFLLLWPTKWPQYTMIVMPALCLAAGEVIGLAYRRFREFDDYWAWLKQMAPAPPLSFWIVAGIAVVAVATIYVSTSVQLIVGRLGWSHFTTQSTLIPSNTVNVIEAGAGEEMIVGTTQGVAIWTPPAGTDLPDAWIVSDSESSDLPNNQVRSLALGRDGILWCGTEDGLARYDGHHWQSYDATQMGLSQDFVLALTLGSDGRLWVGTNSGATVYDGQGWTSITAATSGLLDDFVTDLAVEPKPGGDVVWFGTGRGVSRLDTATGRWTSYVMGGEGQPLGSIADLLIDARGRLWIATASNGLHVMDRDVWRSYRVSNSDIPFNSVQALFEAEPGTLWIGTAIPNNPGGVLSAFDGNTWTTYTPRNAGFSGSEPLALALDREQRLWIGTRTAGIDIFRQQQ